MRGKEKRESERDKRWYSAGLLPSCGGFGSDLKKAASLTVTSDYVQRLLMLGVAAEAAEYSDTGKCEKMLMLLHCCVIAAA
jgi:hypothetical protein